MPTTIANVTQDSVFNSPATGIVQAAYDLAIDWNLRKVPIFRQFADKKPVAVDKPGSSVTFNIATDLAAQSATLVENQDPDSVVMSNTNKVTVTLNEYGNSVKLTRRVVSDAFTQVDKMAAETIAFNMRDSLDNVIRDVIRVGNYRVKRVAGAVTYDTAFAAPSTSALATDTITSLMIRTGVAKMRGLAAPEWDGTYFLGLIHPDVSADLRTETGAAAWRDPHVYSENANGQIWRGEIGAYEGCRWIETPRNYFATDGGVGGNTVKIHRTLLLGRQALAEAVSIEPTTVIGPVTDSLKRFQPVGWYGLLGWSLYRQESIVRLETSSSF